MTNHPKVRIAAPADATTLGRCIGKAFAYDPTIDGVGGALWLAPGQPKSLSIPGQAAIGRHMLAPQSWRYILRADRLDRTVAQHRPKAPHYYLFAIGVLAESRQKGFAGALLEHTLSRADKEGMPAYLENSNPKNAPLYERHGFVANSPFNPSGGCPPLIPMWREPRT